MEVIKKYTHKVIDTMYYPDEDEGNVCFWGTLQECIDFLNNVTKYGNLSCIAMQIVPLTKEELIRINNIK